MPRLSVLTSEGLPDALFPASLFPQPLPLISPNQETQKQCLNLGGGSHVPSVPGQAGASLPSEWQMIPGDMNSAEPAPTTCSESSILGPGSPCPFLPGPWLSPQSTCPARLLLAPLPRPVPCPLYLDKELKGADPGRHGLTTGLSEGRGGEGRQLIKRLIPPSTYMSGVSSWARS